MSNLQLLYKPHKGQTQVAFTEIYQYLPSLTIKTFDEKIENGDSFGVYIGSPECQDCLEFEKTIVTIAKEYQISTDFYYLNIYWLRKDDMSNYEKFKKTLNFTQIPNFYMFQNGKPKSMIEWSQKGLEKSDILQWLRHNKLISVER